MLKRSVLMLVALPGVVAFLVPLLVFRPAPPGTFRWGALALLVPGTVLLVWCVREFAVRGKGTLAPWDPPRRLVTSGPYRVSRNPMYLGVLLILLGWAAGFASLVLLAYALGVGIVFHARVVYQEEPWLRQRERETWTHYAARVPRWLFPSRRAVAYAWLGGLLLLPIGGLIYEAYADGMAAREFAPPGTLVDIGGRRLHLLCIGEGEPVVFFEASGWGTATSLSRVRDRVASRTRVCSYDRSGVGWSDPGDAVTSAGELARELAVLQDRAKLHGPHVLVASSVGGLTVEMFARQYPERVAGLVFLDPITSLVLQDSLPGWVTPAACTTAVLAHFGFVRLADPFRWRGATSDEARQAAALTYRAQPWGQLCAISRGVPRTRDEFEQAPALPDDVPLIVLSAATAGQMVPPAVERIVNVDALGARMRASHQQLAMLSTNGQWDVVAGSTHLIGDSQPEPVAEAVLAVIDELRGPR